MVDSFFQTFLDSLFPETCALCGLAADRPLPLCLACEQELPANDRCCARCAIPLAAVTRHGEQVCGQCQQQPPPFQRVVAPWLYSPQLASLVHQWKYQRQWHLSALLAYLWCRGAQGYSRVDLVVPVPLHWTRFWRRGANQAELLAREILRQHPALAARTSCTLTRRTRATGNQSQMGATARGANLQRAFTARQPCDNLRLAVVDDVFTTGATASALSRELIAAGAHHVEVWCLARTPAPRSELNRWRN